jgi:hypothetical protein
MSEPNAKHGTWHDVDHDSVRFQALLRKYHGDYQQATDAYLRGEEGDPHQPGGSPNPM